MSDASVRRALKKVLFLYYSRRMHVRLVRITYHTPACFYNADFLFLWNMNEQRLLRVLDALL